MPSKNEEPKPSGKLKWHKIESGSVHRWVCREFYWGEYTILANHNKTHWTVFFEDGILGHPGNLKRAKEMCARHRDGGVKSAGLIDFGGVY
jgi:hypothetical protein